MHTVNKYSSGNLLSKTTRNCATKTHQKKKNTYEVWKSHLNEVLVGYEILYLTRYVNYTSPNHPIVCRKRKGQEMTCSPHVR